MPERAPLLQVNSLRTYFTSRRHTVKAVDGVSFEVYSDEVLGIVGESGCGKSVTALSILNVLPENGEIIDGSIVYRNGDESVDISGLDPNGPRIRDIRGKEIAMIFQEPMTAFSPVHTIGNQIGEAIELHIGALDQAARDRIGDRSNRFLPITRWLGKNSRKKAVRNQTINILSRVGMPNPEENLHAYPYELSGGMRQRALIAMALVCNPEILIADEPTTALDVTLQAQVLALMREMKEAYQMSVIYITHDLGVIAEMADRVVVMYLGKVMETASVDDLFHNPLHPYTRALLQSVPQITGAIEKLVPIEGTVPSPMEMPSGCRFRTRCPHAIPGLCNVKEPEVLELEKGHQVSCFLFDIEGNSVGSK